MGATVTHETPVGALVPVCRGGLNNPAVEIHLMTPDYDDVLLGLVEFDVSDRTLNWVRWNTLESDDSDPVRFSLGIDEIRRQLAARKSDGVKA